MKVETLKSWSTVGQKIACILQSAYEDEDEDDSDLTIFGDVFVATPSKAEISCDIDLALSTNTGTDTKNDGKDNGFDGVYGSWDHMLAPQSRAVKVEEVKSWNTVGLKIACMWQATCEDEEF
jgi:hypothetical protein